MQTMISNPLPEDLVAVADCRQCREEFTTRVTQAEVDFWLAGSSLQQVWFHKTPDERELILNSQFGDLIERPFPAGPMYFCPPCWDSVFPEEE